MRVLFAVATYWPAQDGVANITGYLAEGLAKHGHEIIVLSGTGDNGRQESVEEEEHNGVTIRRMRIFTKWPLEIKGLDEKSSPKEYLKQIEICEPDVLIVVCSQTWTLDWLIPHLDKIKCVKIFYSHGYSKWSEVYSYKEMIKNRNILGVWIIYLCKRYYDKLYKYIAKFDLAIYLSEQNNSNKYAQKYRLLNGKILENAIDDKFFENTMKHESMNKDVIKYLYVANYNENKNQEMLIRAFCEAEIGKSQLVLVGSEDNDYYQYLKRLPETLLAEQRNKAIELNVHLSRDEVIDLYRVCDVFVCPSKSETWSIVAHEAAAVGMPIISTDVGIYSEIAGSYIVENQKEMRMAIEHLYYDEGERRRRGKATSDWIQKQNCRIDDKVDWLEQELLYLLKEKGK